MLKWGKKEKFLQALLDKKIEKRVPALECRPDLYEDLTYVVEIFGVLNATRQFDFGAPLPLKIESIEATFRLFDVADPDEREEHLYCILQLDKAWREWIKDHPEVLEEGDANPTVSNRRTKS